MSATKAYITNNTRRSSHQKMFTRSTPRGHGDGDGGDFNNRLTIEVSVNVSIEVGSLFLLKLKTVFSDGVIGSGGGGKKDSSSSSIQF